MRCSIDRMCTLSVFLCAFFLLAGLPDAAVASQDDDEEEKLTVEPYGFARLDTIWSSAPMQHPQYSMWVAPQTGETRYDPELTVYARLTRFGLRVPPVEIGDGVRAEARIEADFQNGGSESRPLPRLRHGFGRISSSNFSLLAGQTWDLASPLYPSTHADALMWNAGNLGDRRPQLRGAWTPSLGDFGLRAAGGIGTNGAITGQDLDGNGARDGLDAGLPKFQTLVELQGPTWVDDTFTVGASGHYAIQRTDSPPEDVAGDATQFDSWSVSGHLELPLASFVTLRGEGFVGDNLADIRGGIGQSINRDSGETIRSAGGWAEAVLQASESYQVAVGGSVDRPFTDDLSDRGTPGARTLNRTLYTVHKWRPWRPIQFGLEYWFWQTDYRRGGLATAQRVNFHTSVFF